MSKNPELVWCENLDHQPKRRHVLDADAHLETPDCVWPMCSGLFAGGRRREAGYPSMTAVETLDPREAVIR